MNNVITLTDDNEIISNNISCAGIRDKSIFAY